MALQRRMGSVVKSNLNRSYSDRYQNCTAPKPALLSSLSPFCPQRIADGQLYTMNQSRSSALSRFRLAVSREFNSLWQVLRPRLLLWTFCAKLLPEQSLSYLRCSCYRLAGCSIDRSVTLIGRMTLIGSGQIASRLHIGHGCVIAHGVVFGLDDQITVGKNVSLGPYVKLYTATHPLGFGSRRMTLKIVTKPIVIEEGVWVGMDSLILPGVTLGQGCVVSAGAVVTTSVPPNTLVSGNPATVQKQLPFGDR